MRFFLVPPLLLLFFGIFVFRWNGPYFFSGNLDPDYPYLLNSLAVSQSLVPGHWDHPGMTIQALGGLVIDSTTLGLPADEQAFRVLSEPEFYANLIGWALLLFHAASLALAGFIVFRATSDPWFTLLFQAAPLSFSSIWPASAKLSPDVLTWSLGMLLMAFLLQRLTEQPSSAKKENIYSWMAGIISGLILATKITGLPLVLVGIWAYRRSKSHLLRFFLGTSGAFLCLALLIQGGRIFEFGYFFLRWLARLALYRGRYGGGEMGLPSFTVFLSDLWMVTSYMLPLAIGLLIMIIFLVSSWRARSRFRNREAYLSLAFLTSLSLAQLLVVAKHPGDRYMIPQASVIALALPLFILLFGEFFSLTYEKSKTIMRATALLFFGISLFAGGKFVYAKQSRLMELAQVEALTEKASSLNCNMAYFYRASAQPYALAFGNNYARYAYSSLLKKIYPNYIAFEPGRGFVDFERNDISKEEVFAKGTVCLRGTPTLEGDKIFFPGFTLKPLGESASDDGLFIFERTDAK